MAKWWNRVLAAIGFGGHKAESDVSYDPAVDEDVPGDEGARNKERPGGGGPWASG